VRISLREINEQAVRDACGFVARCDREYDERVGRAADEICANMHSCPIVLIAGPSGSGKTTTARKLDEELERRGVITHSFSMDDYYKDMDLEKCPRTEDGQPYLESPLLLDMDLMNEHFAALSRGETVRVPRFDFAARQRSRTRFEDIHLGENEIAIFEGIHALNDEITGKNPGAYTIFVAPENEIVAQDGGVFLPEWTRLIRRAVRDARTRGADIFYTLQLWKNVMRGEREFIRPFMGRAKMHLNTSLEYEMPVLAAYAAEMLKNVTEDTEGYEHVAPIIPWISRFAPLDASNLGEKSLIREFIGGSAYDY